MREIQTRAPHFCLAGCVQFGGNLTRRVGFLSNRRRLVADVVRGGDAIEWNSTATRHKTCFAGWIRPQTELHPRWHPTRWHPTLASLLTNQRGGYNTLARGRARKTFIPNEEEQNERASEKAVAETRTDRPGAEQSGGGCLNVVQDWDSWAFKLSQCWQLRFDTFAWLSGLQ
jgi:hypothetical protein